MTITDMVEQAHANAVKKGFWDNPRETGTLIALIHSEVSEALDAEDCAEFCEELSDIVIRICDLAGGRNIDLQGIVELSGLEWEENKEKHRINCTAITDIGQSFNKLPQNMDRLKDIDVNKDRLGMALEILENIDLKYAIDIHKMLSYALECDRKNLKDGFEAGLAKALLLTFRWAAQKGYSLEEAITEKMARNRERPRLHGKKY